MSSIFQQPPNNYLYTIGLLNKLAEQSNNVSRTGIVTDAALHSVTIPLRTLITDGQRVYVRGRGQNSGNGGSKTLTARFNTTTLLTIALPAVVAASIYYVDFEVIRTSSTTVDLMIQQLSGYSLSGGASSLTLTGGARSAIAVPSLDTSDQLLEFLITIPVGGDNVTMSTSFAIAQ